MQENGDDWRPSGFGSLSIVFYGGRSDLIGGLRICKNPNNIAGGYTCGDRVEYTLALEL